MTDDLNEPVEIRWHFAHHGALAMMYPLVSLGGLWTAFAEPGLRFLGPFWFATLIQGLVSLALSIDRRPKIVLARDGFSCPAWFVGTVAWSDVAQFGESSFMGKSYLVLRREKADGLVWLGVDRLLRIGESRRRAPILFRIGEMDVSAERFSEIVRARVAAAHGGEATAPQAALRLIGPRSVLFSPLYAREFFLSWLAIPASLLFGPPAAIVPFVWLFTVLMVLSTFGPESLPIRKALG